MFKRLGFLVLTLTLFFTVAQARKMSGYYVSIAGDTVQADFYIPFSKARHQVRLSDIKKRIRIDGGQRLTPSMVKLVVIHDEGWPDNILVPLRGYSSATFVQRIRKGKLNLYQSANKHGFDGSEMPFYILQLDKHANLIINSMGFGVRKKIIPYFGNYPEFVDCYKDKKKDCPYKTYEEMVDLFNSTYK